jgi:hypothetical protein
MITAGTKTKKIKRNYFSDKPVRKIILYWYWINLKGIIILLGPMEWFIKKLRCRAEAVASKHFGTTQLFKSIKN